MPRFFFNTDDGVRPFRDEDGVDLPSIDSVPNETVALICKLIDVGKPLEPQTLVATVRDITGTAVFRSTMSVTGERFAD